MALFGQVRRWLAAREVACRQFLDGRKGLAVVERKAYTPPPHDHIGDYTRSKTYVTAGGSVRVMCAVNGCGESMVLGNNIARDWPVECERMEAKIAAMLNDPRQRDV